MLAPSFSNRFEFLDSCRRRDVDPLSELQGLSLDNVIVIEFLRLGISHAKRTERHKSRELIKKGLSHKIKSADVRREAEEWIEIVSDIESDVHARFIGGMSAALLRFSDTLFGQWKVNGAEPLGSLSPERLMAEAIDEESKANGHTKNAAFYRGLASMGEPGRPIWEVIDLTAAECLRVKIFEMEAAA